MVKEREKEREKLSERRERTESQTSECHNRSQITDRENRLPQYLPIWPMNKTEEIVIERKEKGKGKSEYQTACTGRGARPKCQKTPRDLDSNPKTTVSAECGTTPETLEGPAGTNRNLY